MIGISIHYRDGYLGSYYVKLSTETSRDKVPDFVRQIYYLQLNNPNSFEVKQVH